MGKIAVNLGKIPNELHCLIPLARYFGIPDDVEREKRVRTSTLESLQQLRAAVIEHDYLLDAWLAGPEATASHFSDEYVMFSAMRMAADHAA